jgi:hypothetical protein
MKTNNCSIIFSLSKGHTRVAVVRVGWVILMG